MIDKAEHRSIPRLQLLTSWVGFVLVLVGVVAGLGTFAILTNLTPITPTSQVTAFLLAINLLTLVLMAAMIGSQLFLLMRERRRGTPGAGLHVRLASLFSLVAVVPAIVVAVFAYVTLNRGLDTWFSQRTQAIVNSAVGVAEDYIRSAAEATPTDSSHRRATSTA